MTDTHESIKVRFHQMMMSRSPLERLEMGCSMFDTAKEIVRNSIINQGLGSSPQEINRQIFLRFYSQDFDEDQQKKILNSIK